MMVPPEDDWKSRPTLSVAEVAKILSIGLNQTYTAVKAGEIPSLRLGRTYRIPTAKLRAMLGLDE